MEKDSFILHDDQFECFSLLSMEQRGLLITAIFEFRRTGTTTQDLSEAAYMAYYLITRQLDRDSQRYERICEKRRKAVESRYSQQATNENKCSNELQMNTNVDHTDTDTDTDTDNTPPIVPPRGEKEDPKEPKEKKLSTIEKRFNAFWKAYPKKVAKATALKWFEKNKPSEDLTQRIIDAIEAQKKSIEWTKDGGEFIPHPSTWLNQGRWEDELTPINNAPKAAENRSQQAKAHTEVNIPKYCTEDADDMFSQALRRTYGG